MKNKRKNSEQAFLQWWWNIKLDSNDRDMFYFFGMMMEAPLFVLLAGSGGFLPFVILQIAWAIWMLLVAYRSISREITKLTDEYRNDMDNSSTQDVQVEDYFLDNDIKGKPEGSYGTYRNAQFGERPGDGRAR